MMKKNDLVTLTIDGYTAEGMGVGRADGMAVFVPASAAGDVLRCRIVKVQKTYAYGRIEQVVTNSPHRIAPACPVYPKCGGCAFLHLSYEEELRLKGQRVEDALRRIGGFDIKIGPAVGSDRRGYRNKAQFPVCLQDGRAAFGFYRSRSHQIVPTDRCLIQGPRTNALAAAVCRWMDESGAEPYDEETNTGLVRRIYVREGARGCLLCIVANGGSLPQPERLTALAREAAPDLRGIVLNINREKTNRIMGDVCRTLWGDGSLRDTLLGLEYDLSPLSFYQVNHAQAEELYRCALDFAALKENETALDLYCGAGTITLLLARRCREAIGNEIVPEAVRDANENAARNDVRNVRFILGDAGEAAYQLAREGLRPDVIVTDPPRKGMDRKAVEAIAAMAPKRLVYVSCDPASLARDCALLRDLGYKLEKAKAYDMFPGTANVETCVLLCREKFDDPDRKFISVPYEPTDEEIVPNLAPSATYTELKQWIEETYHTKVSSLYIAQVKAKHGLDMRENYNKPKSPDVKQPKVPADKERMIEEALRHFGLIPEKKKQAQAPDEM